MLIDEKNGIEVGTNWVSTGQGFLAPGFVVKVRTLDDGFVQGDVIGLPESLAKQGMAGVGFGLPEIEFRKMFARHYGWTAGS